MFNSEKDCWCEDPFHVGQKLKLCGQAICLKLNNMKVPKLAIVAASVKVEDDSEESSTK